MIKKLLLTVFLVANLFLVSAVFGQTVGDYQSNGSGNWTTLSNWQRWDGSSWVMPTAGQGYPGQNAGTGVVTIRNGYTITLTTSITNLFTKLIIGDVTSSGVFTVGADIPNFNTLDIIINPTGNMNFTGQNELKLPANSGIKILAPGQIITTGNGTCTNNTAIYIGGVKFGVCKGAGNAEYAFDELNNFGGTLFSTPTSNTPVCQGNSINLSGSYSGPTPTTITYSWSIKAPDNTVTTSTTTNPSFTALQIGNYQATLTCNALYDTRPYSNSETIMVTVNSLPTITSQPISQLDCEGASVNFTVFATGSGLTYSWQYKKPSDLSYNVILSNSTNVDHFNENKITIRNVGSTQFPDGTLFQVIVTNSSGCSVTSSAATLSVNEITGILPTNSAVTQCYGTDYSYTVNTSYPTNVVSYQWKSSVVSGVWNDVVDGTHFLGAKTAILQIKNGTPAESAEYRVYITFGATGADCNVNSFTRSRSITFLPEVTAPIATITQPSCTVATGSVVLSGLPASGTWTLTRTGTSNATTTGTGTSTTISGLATGTYNFTVFDGTCTSLPANVVINVQPGTPLVPTIDAYTLPSFADNDGTITLGNLPSGNWVGHQIKDGVTTTISGTGSPYTLTGLSNGNYEFEVVELCISPRSAPAPLTTVPYIPAVSPAININCTGFTANWPATPTATAYLLDVSTTASFTTGTFVGVYQNFNVGNVLTFPISGIPSGTYYYRIRARNATLISLYSATVAVTPLINTYSGTWSLGTPPTTIGTQNLVFNASFTANADMAGCSCTVNTGNVIINSGKNLTVTNEVKVLGGSLTFENNASLTQINNVTNVGNITYKRNYTGGEFDYTYWSSPVAGQNLLALSPATKLDKFFYFNSSANDWVQENPATATMAIGKGYIIRGVPIPSGPPPPGFGTNSFFGIPNNGDVSVPVTFTNPLNLLPTDADYGVSYLLGNPYPSAIYADQFLFDNQSVIDGTLYFWTHNTPIAIGTPDPGSGAWAYSGNDYASYNITGGVGTGSGTTALSGGIEPSGKIAAGQGFFATSIETGTVNFTNAMRLDSYGNPLNNSNFYKTKSPKSKTANPIEKNRVWLNLTNTQGAFKQTLVGYITGATNAWDSLYDGESYDGNDFLDFYSILQDKNLTIQGRALPFDENDEIPLGYRVAVDGTFSVAIGQTDGVLTNHPLFLEDKLANTIFDLKGGKYTFNTVAGTFNDRFVLRYKDKSLSIEETENDGITVLYSNNYKTLIIRNSLKDTTVNSVTLYNITGQKIANWEVKGREQNSIQIPIKNLPSEIYIVKIETTQGEFSKKIIVK